MSVSKNTATSSAAATSKGDGHSGVFSSKYRKNPQIAAAVIDAMDAWRKASDISNFDDDLCNSLWACLCDVSIDDMRKLIKASVKRETKKKAKFEVDEKVLPKPPRSAFDIFNKELTAKAKATDTKLKLEERHEQWSKLSQADKDKYTKKCDDAKAHYKAEYEKLRQQAIDAGDFPADAPKKPLTTYFLFRAHMLDELKTKHSLTPEEEQLPEDQKKKLRREKHLALNEEIKVRWESSKSSNDALYTKLTEQSQKQTAAHNVKYAEWKKTERERQARKNGDAVAHTDDSHVSVVSTTTTSTTTATTPTTESKTTKKVATKKTTGDETDTATSVVDTTTATVADQSTPAKTTATRKAPSKKQ